MLTLDMALPRPLVRHSSGGPSLGHSFNKPFPGEIPSPFGPRHCGQLGAEAKADAARPRATAASKVRFMQRERWRVGGSELGFVSRFGRERTKRDFRWSSGARCHGSATHSPICAWQQRRTARSAMRPRFTVKILLAAVQNLIYGYFGNDRNCRHSKKGTL